MFPAVPNKLKSTRAHMFECKLPIHSSPRCTRCRLMCLVCLYATICYCTILFWQPTKQSWSTKKECRDLGQWPKLGWRQIHCKSIAKSRKKNNWNNWRIRISGWEANISMLLSPFRCLSSICVLIFFLGLLLMLPWLKSTLRISTHDFLCCVLNLCK